MNTKMMPFCMYSLILLLIGCTATLVKANEPSTGLIKPVNANGDGIIDKNDVLLLMRKANDYSRNKIQPLLDKTGIQTDEQGNITTPDAKDRLEKRLSFDEYKELKEALNECNHLRAQVDATLKEIIPNLENIEKLKKALARIKTLEKDQSSSSTALASALARIKTVKLIMEEDYDKKGESFSVGARKEAVNLLKHIGYQVVDEKGDAILKIEVWAQPSGGYYGLPLGSPEADKMEKHVKSYEELVSIYYKWYWTGGEAKATAALKIEKLATITGERKKSKKLPAFVYTQRDVTKVSNAPAWSLARECTQGAIIKVFGKEGIKDIVTLIKILEYDSAFVRQVAENELVEIGKPAVEMLIQTLKNNKDEDVRAIVARVLGKIGNTLAVPPLIVALKDENECVRRETADALGELKDPNAVGPLIEVLKDETTNIGIDWRAARALGKIGMPALERVTELLSHESATVRERAVEALGEMGKPALEYVIAALKKDKNAPVRKKAIYALMKIDSDRAVEPLIVALKDEDADVRKSAAVAFRDDFHDTRAIEPLIAALDNENKDVREVAAYALKKITEEDFGQDRAKWREWWQKNKDSFQDTNPSRLNQEKNTDNLLREGQERLIGSEPNGSNADRGERSFYISGVLFDSDGTPFIEDTAIVLSNAKTLAMVPAAKPFSDMYSLFNRWGLKFKHPKDFREWPADRVKMMKQFISKELADSLKSGHASTGWRELKEFTYIVSPEESVALTVTVLSFKEEPSIEALLRERQSVLKDASTAKDVTKVNKLEISKLGSHQVILEDVERSNGGRGICIHLISRKNVYQITWIVNDKSDYSIWEKDISFMIQSLEAGFTNQQSKVYSNSKYGISFSFPNRIELYTRENPGPLAEIFSRSPGTLLVLVNPKFIDENINVKVSENVSDPDVIEFKSLLEKNSLMPIPGYQRISVSMCSIGKLENKKAVEHIYNMRGNVPGKMRQISFSHKNRGFTFTCGTATDRYDSANKKFFDVVFNSMSFERTYRITGILHDSEGSPLVGKTVYLFAAEIDPNTSEFKVGLEKNEEGKVISPGGAITITDANGRFEMKVSSTQIDEAGLFTVGIDDLWGWSTVSRGNKAWLFEINNDIDLSKIIIKK